MTDNELTLAASYITALASEHNPNEKIKILLSSLLTAHRQEADFFMHETQTEKAVSSVITFSLKEISNMPKTFKKEFIANGMIAHVLKRKTSKYAYSYEIRYRKNGYHIYVSSYSLEKAKEKFLSAVSPENIEKHRVKKQKLALNSFLFVTQEWLTFKKADLNKRTHKNYESYCNRFLFPVLGDLPIASIKTIDISNIMATVQGRVYEDLRIVLNSVFKYALANSLITNNPMLLIPFKKAERNNRRALTNEELKKLFERLNLRTISKLSLSFFSSGFVPVNWKTHVSKAISLLQKMLNARAAKLNIRKFLFVTKHENYLTFPLLSKLYILPTASTAFSNVSWTMKTSLNISYVIPSLPFVSNTFVPTL